MRLCFVATGIVLAAGVARADTVSFSTQVAPIGYDAYGGMGFVVATPGFDDALGRLDGVSMTVTGSVQDDIFSGSGDLVPFAAVFNNIGAISGFGFSQSGVLSSDAGFASTFLADTIFR